MIKRLEALQKFLQSLNSLRQQGLIKTVDQAVAFAKQEFGEVNDLFRRQIEQIFKGPSKKAPPPGGGGITSIKNAPKKETPDQESGIMASEEASPLMQKLEKGADILREFKRPGMDLTTGMARTAARVILDNAGIKIPEKVDPLEAIAQEFGADVLMDLRDVADELIEKERAGKITESMGEFLEKRGMFNLQRGRTDIPKGMSDEELQQIKKEVDQEKMLKDFDPTDRTENAMGGRIGFEDGTPKNKKGIMKVIKKIPKVGKIAGGLEAAYNTLSKKFGPDVLKTADEIPPKEPSELAKAVKSFEARNLKTTDIIKDIKKLDPMDAMKEMNEVVAKRGKYKNLDDDEVKKIFDDTNDHIFERDIKPKETDMDFDEQKILDDVDEAYGVTPEMKKELNKMNQKYEGKEFDRLYDDYLYYKNEEGNFTGSFEDFIKARRKAGSLDAEMIQLKKIGAPKMAERFELKQKYPGLDENLITFIVDDTDPQRKAEVLATIDQAFELMKRGKSPDEILSILKRATDRTKQARGGLSYLMGM